MEVNTTIVAPHRRFIATGTLDIPTARYAGSRKPLESTAMSWGALGGASP